MVTVYLDKTMDTNTYDEILSGLTNPKHEEKARNLSERMKEDYRKLFKTLDLTEDEEVHAAVHVALKNLDH